MSKITKRKIPESYRVQSMVNLNLGDERLEKGDYSKCIALYQDCVELSIKSILSLYGRMFPHRHEVSKELGEIKGTPDWFKERVPRIVIGSITLDSWMIAARYGYPKLDIPPMELFDKRLAELAREFAVEILIDCVRLYSEIVYPKDKERT